MARYLVVGGAGFIGSHFLDRLLGPEGAEAVTIYDNFTSGRREHFAHHAADPRLAVVEAQVADLDRLTEVCRGVDVVIHLASNPDIAAAATDPDIDFREGTQLTRNVVEAMRRAGVGTILYASGSGVYGELGDYEIPEDHGPLLPISTYGASKLAGEALICSYAHMFDMRGRCFRFANVVGPRQTHGVGFDFVRRLRRQPAHLQILGDGSQCKSYVHVDDVVSAVLLGGATGSEPFQVYNVGTRDAITVKEIADLACELLGLSNVELRFGSGDRGWKGDVPVVRLNTERIRALGWSNARSAREALRDSILAMILETRDMVSSS